MLKIALFVLLVLSTAPLFAFAEPSLQLSSDQKNIGALDSILVYGTITGVKSYVPVTITVTAPDGEVVYSPIVTFDNEGNFKRLIHPTIPSFKIGTYTVTATHEQVPYSAKLQFTVTSGNIPNIVSVPESSNKMDSDLYVLSNAVEGDTQINITGHTIWADRDVTLTLYSPSGNLITVAQITPTANGDFSTIVKIGGSLWKEDGTYRVTAHQGDHSELTDTVKVEISDGVVVPEFGTIAAMILVVSLISIIFISARSRLSITKF